jgi:hypothetical protein
LIHVNEGGAGGRVAFDKLIARKGWRLAMQLPKVRFVDIVIFAGAAVNAVVIVLILIFYVF